jgi:FkbM family methyltransferase
MKIVPTRYGKMYILEMDSIISSALQLYGEWAQNEINLIGQLIAPGFNVLDVGAFIGTHTLAFSTFVGKEGMVYSFEPRKEIFEFLSSNIELNACKNVIAHNMALSDNNYKLTLNSIEIIEPDNYGGFSLGFNSGSNHSNSYEIPVKTIDTLGIKKIDFIKLDVEGMERKILDGGVMTIERDRPIIFCECNSLIGGNEDIIFCQKIGYRVFGFLASAYNAGNINKIEENVFGPAKELSLLLIPQEKADKIIHSTTAFNTFQINNLEDLILPLLHKPQYAYDVLSKTSAFLSLGLSFPSPSIEETNQEILKGMQEKENIIQEKDSIIKEKEDIIKGNENIIREKENIIQEKDSIIKEKEDIIKGNENIIREKENMIQEKDSIIKEKEDIVKVRDYKIQEKDNIIKHNELIIKENRDLISRLYNSKSWKFTKPLRIINRKILDFFN